MRYYVTLASGRSYTVFAPSPEEAKQRALYENAWAGYPGSWVKTCFAG